MDLKFRLHQRVMIKEIERPGIVKQINIADGGIQYEVRYFWDGEVKTVWFYADELMERKDG